MSAPGISKHALAVVDAVIAAYEGGDSYSTVARDFGLHTSTVQSIMRKYARDSIRTPTQARKVRINPKPAVESLTLAALGLMRVGPCKACGILLVAKTRENPVKGQTWGLCLDFARRAA